jgi:hypothetical protein
MEKGSHEHVLGMRANTEFVAFSYESADEGGRQV